MPTTRNLMLAQRVDKEDGMLSRYPEGALRGEALAEIVTRDAQDVAVRESHAAALVRSRMVDEAEAEPQGYRWPSTDKDARRDLMLRFESIGSDCTIGLVQRHYGAEPHGLLRWTATNLDMLIPAIEAEFDGLGEPDNTEIFVGIDNELFVKDTRWNLVTHTFIDANDVSIPALHSKMCKRFAFLRNKFLNDLRDGSKTLVFKSEETSVEALTSLHTAVSALGAAPILSIQKKSRRCFTDAPKLIFVRPGLLIGFVEQVDVAAQTDEDYAEWFDILEDTETLLNRRSPPGAQAGRFARTVAEAWQ